MILMPLRRISLIFRVIEKTPLLMFGIKFLSPFRATPRIQFYCLRALSSAIYIVKANSIELYRVTQKKRVPALIRPRFLVFGPNEMKLWS